MMQAQHRPGYGHQLSVIVIVTVGPQDTHAGDRTDRRWDPHRSRQHVAGWSHAAGVVKRPGSRDRSGHWVTTVLVAGVRL